MDFKLNLSLKHFNPSTIGFFDYILQERSNPASEIATHISTPDASELFQIIENEFEELNKPTTLIGVLKIINLTIQHTTTWTANYPSFMKDLLAKHSSNEDRIIATQILYQTLTSLPNDFPIEQFRTSGFITEILQISLDADSVKLQIQLALCISLFIKKFQVNALLETIWDQILAKKWYYLLVHYIDSLISKFSIYERCEFWQLIMTLLAADSRDDRKLGTFLVRKILKFLSTTPIDLEVEKLFNWSREYSNQLLTSYLTYLTILENLEEKQSHLILPSLETLESIALGENTPWIRIVLLQMLKHNNTLVLRWSLDYLYCHFKNLVLDNNILEEFLIATNNTWLYNENATNAFTLPAFSRSEQKSFLEVFAKVTWKSVPMHVWLLRMTATHWTGLESKLVIDIARRLRQLQNRCIRFDCRHMFISIFESCIGDMPLSDFMNLLDALYSLTDLLSEEMLSAMVQKIQISPYPFICFTACAILIRQQISSDYESIIMDAFDKVKVEDHQWVRVLVRFGFSQSTQQQEFCKKHYDIEVSEPDIPDPPLNEVMSEYESKLSWDNTSRTCVHEMTLDWFTSTTMREAINQYGYEYLGDNGGVRTVISIASSFRKFTVDPKFLDRFVIQVGILIKKMEDIELLVWYLIEACAEVQPELLYKFANGILDIDVTNNRLAVNVFRSVLSFSDHQKVEARQLLIRGILFGELLSGDLRVEHDYAARAKLLKGVSYESTYEIRQTCIRFLKRIDKALIELLKIDLIAQSKNMSIRKPRYFENSKHHRLKLRIAQALASLNQITPVWNDYYLYAILQENNQTNVTYIYEFIVAATIPESELMKQMENLKNLSTSSQVSMFAISYLFSVRRNAFADKLITLILPWTMGSNFNTRLYAQITIHHLLRQFEIQGFDYLKIGIETSLRESPNAYEKLCTDVRYNFPEDFDFLDTFPIIYVTVVAEDEHPTSRLEDCNDCESLRAARNLNLSKRKSTKETENDLLLSKPLIEDVQRKMNPEMGHNESYSSEVAKTDMIVVASLIDKLPNLGGIARTSEVLGIKNLILDSTKHAQNKEFKNLSMTAENWINISEVKPKDLEEFLINKKTEGYEIVGAEQTAKSINFMEFKFPTKCVLLLGHEKEGIPANLIALLDYAVEIPQFGMVRSLNVHVTGALFMYEYCKQQLYNAKDG